MIIKSILVPKDALENSSLDDLNLKGLGRFVVLSGKNGSGKTRILNLIKDMLPRYAKDEFSISSFKDQLNEIERRMEFFKDNQEVINNIKREISLLTRNFEISTKFILSDENRIGCIDFIPKPNNFRNHINDVENVSEESIKNAKHMDIKNIHQICSHYIKKISLTYSLSKSTITSSSLEHINNAEKNFESLRNLIKTFIGADLTINTLGKGQLFGGDISEVALSEGQNVSLQIAIALHAKLSESKKLVFILDEPENHLHPSSVVNFISNLERAAPEAQFFIATHSIPLISYLHAKDQNSLWFVENGSVKRAGRTPEDVLSSLLGDQDRINELRNFTELPEILAQINYAVQCLAPPGVVGATTGDTQNNQIYRVLSNLKKGGPIRLLDYGAGRGRILDGLAENASGKPEEQFDYFAFDNHSDHTSECKLVISRYYDNPNSRHVNNLNDYIQASQPLLNSFDVVLLCNVLHEISPHDWVNMFKEGAAIDSLLSANGYLLIVEDNRIPVGEKAHDFGFIVLDRAEFRHLFAIPADVTDEFLTNDARAGRGLKAHLIHKKFLRNITSLTVKKAVESVKNIAETEIKRMRDLERVDYKIGLENAFWVHQYTNSSLYLSSRG